MSTNAKIVINHEEDMVCRKMVRTDATPNTVLSSDPGITLVVKIGKESKVCMKNDTTIYALFHPGKTTKLFGGNKPYESCEIYAIDQSMDFQAEWGIAGNNAMPSFDDMKIFDKSYQISCKAIAVGKYYYKIGNYYSFIQSFNTNEKPLTRDDVREYLRSETTGMIQGYVAPKLLQYGVVGTQKKLGECAEELTEMINKHLENRGLCVYNVELRVDYVPEYRAKRDGIFNTAMDVIGGMTRNEGKLSDADVERKFAEIGIDIIKAKNGSGAGQPAPVAPAAAAPADGGVFCTHCGNRLKKGARFCDKCGQRIN